MKAAGNFSELIKAVGEKSKKPAEASFLLFYVAGVQGFEPRMAESESAALPLGDTPIGVKFYALTIKIQPLRLPESKRLFEIGWGTRIRTSEWWNQNPLPYRLAIPQQFFTQVNVFINISL